MVAVVAQNSSLELKGVLELLPDVRHRGGGGATLEKIYI